MKYCVTIDADDRYKRADVIRLFLEAISTMDGVDFVSAEPCDPANVSRKPPGTAAATKKKGLTFNPKGMLSAIDEILG